jgi:hypothetical protein
MTEYTDPNICYPIRVKKLVHIPRNTDDYPKGFFGEDVGYWAEPDYEHFKELMLRVYENYDEALQKGREAHKVILKKYTYSKVCRKIDTLLKQHMGVE